MYDTIMDDTELEDVTKHAMKEAEDTKVRLDHRNKLRVEKDLVLEIDPETNSKLVTVDDRIATKLYMYDVCFESIKRIHPSACCIIAHRMSLGKNLQAIALVNTVLTHRECKVSLIICVVFHLILIFCFSQGRSRVCPLSTVANWTKEFKNWLPEDTKIQIYKLTVNKQRGVESQHCATIRKWLEGGVLVLAYTMFRMLANENNLKIQPTSRDLFVRALVNTGPQLIICDEGHILKKRRLRYRNP